MYLPKETLTIDDTRLIGYWHDNKVPVYEVTTVHGLNQIVGHIKHNNANHGTVLYRGQANLHERLIPSILHGSPTHSELVKRADELSKHIECFVLLFNGICQRRKSAQHIKSTCNCLATRAAVTSAFSFSVLFIACCAATARERMRAGEIYGYADR